MGPNYLSARSAEVILSDIRPTRIRADTLRAINALLDELLLQVIATARSVSTEKLKAGLLRALPTSLGKDAILEAEIELRAYHERTAPAEQLTPQTDPLSPKDFPLQPMSELLRMKCEAYSTLSDFDGDSDLEAQINGRIASVAGTAAPRSQSIAPAALYLTAILEHVCEHVLSNVARVVARDSSRTTAHVQDLFVALCEDETIYVTFKSMKVQDLFDQDNNPVRERRSHSLSRTENGSGSPMLSGTVPVSGAANFERSTTVAFMPDSLDDAGSHSVARTSMDRVKSLNKVFKSAPTLNEQDRNNASPNVTGKHQRTESTMSERLRRLQAFDNSADMTENSDFDNLMKSGATMKLSLTPDRLQTFEVAKEKGQRRAASKLALAHSNSTPTAPLPASPSLNRTKSPSSRSLNTRAGAQDNIPEREEELTALPDPRARSKSVAAVSATEQAPPIPIVPRTRTLSSTVPLAKKDNINGLARKQSLSVGIGPSSFKNPVGRGQSDGSMPKMNRHGPRDSLDDLSDEDVPPVRTPSGTMQPKSNKGSSATRDLIDFLSEGPPDADLPPPDSARSKSGRFRSMVSRLARASSERLIARPNEGLNATSGRTPVLANRPDPSLSLKLVRAALPNVAQATPYDPRSESAQSSSSNDLDVADSGAARINGDPRRHEATPKASTSLPQHPSATARSPLKMTAEESTVGPPISPTQVGDVSVGSQTLAASPMPRSLGLHADDLRAGVARATSAAECRVLVDMFLAQCGHHLSARGLDNAAGPLRTELQQHEHNVVGALLTDECRDGGADKAATAGVVAS